MQHPYPVKRKVRFRWIRPPPCRVPVVLAVAVAALLLLLACEQSGEKVTLLVTVGSEFAACENGSEGKCLVVNGELFYDTVENFQYEEGYYYRLRIERQDLYPDDEEPPQGASKYRYRLIDVISKLPSIRDR